MFHECLGAQRREAGLMKVVTSHAMTTSDHLTGGEAGDLCVLQHLGVEGPLMLTLTSDGHTLELEENV